MSILIEYGLPRTSIQKISNFLREELTEEQVMDFISRNKEQIMKILSPYERERLSACIL